MANPSSQDRRRTERIRFAAPVRLNVKTPGILVDLSEGGALLRVPKPQESGRQVTLTIEEGESAVHLAAKIVRSIPVSVETESATLKRTEFQVAVEFLDLGDHPTGLVRQIVEKYRTGY